MLANVFTKSVRDRWRAMAIALAALTLMLLMAMSVYANFDFSFYDDLPEAFRSLMNIPDNADAGSLAIGVLAGLYGAFTLGGLAISMGSASIAGEEKAGTIGILLGNPKSRAHILLSKMANMVLLTAIGALVLWVAAYAVAGVLNVNLGEMQVGPYMLHLYANVLLYGMLALAIGAWTGSRGLASGVSAGVMVLGFIAVGVFPLIEGWANVAKVFPWYYFDGADPMNNGASLGHLTVLLGTSIGLAGAASVGVNRRDLKGQTVGTTLLDRLRANPLTQKVVDRLAGSTRVSRIWIKTASEHQGLLIIVAYVMFLIMGVLMGPLYALMDQTLLQYTDQLPEELWAFVGSEGGGMGTPEGFYEVETFGLTVPIATMVIAIAIGARALAGEEANRTMGLLLANPPPAAQGSDRESVCNGGAHTGGGLRDLGGCLGRLVARRSRDESAQHRSRITTGFAHWCGLRGTCARGQRRNRAGSSRSVCERRRGAGGLSDQLDLDPERHRRRHCRLHPVRLLPHQ